MYSNVGCSQCGRYFGPGDHGFSHCENHGGISPHRMAEMGDAKHTLGDLEEAVADFLEAQDALDNRELQGPYVEGYFVLLRRRNDARGRLDAAGSSE
ncbi:hypothetical protein [Caldimonas brevitalea]|nr:hypothetical protein [Caldimonas brevitalea]